MPTVTLEPPSRSAPPADPRQALLDLGPSILALARARLRRLHDAQDALQETCLRVLRALPSWKPTAPFAHWVFTIAANVVRDALRRREARPEPPVPAEAPDPVEALVRTDDLDRIRRAIHDLDPAEAAPLLLHLLHDVPPREIAAHLDVPVEILRVRFFRAIRKIRRALKE